MSVMGAEERARNGTSAPARRARPPIMGRLLLGVTQRLRRSRSLALLREIERAPFVSPEEVMARQFARLSSLLEHAEARVPYYRELFRSLKISSRDIRSHKDFSTLPVLTKEIVRERGRELVRDDVPLERLSKHHSGGSTGIPLTFHREAAYMDASEAGTLRNFRQSGWQPGEMIAFFWGGNERLYGMPRWQFELRQHLRRMYQFDPFHSGPEEMARWLARWPKLGVSVAHGYASTIARFAEYIESVGERVAPLRGVFTTAEKLYEPQREVIAHVFGCRVYDLYGSSEVQNIAAECPHGRMHVNADFVVLEVDRGAESRGAAAPEDGRAPFLVTSLWNRAMPFLRYRNEDCGELVEGLCDCGNNFPLMRLNVARTSDNFTLPGGRVVHGEFFTHLMYGSEGISNFQFHQTATDSITLWIVKGPGAEEARARTLQAAIEQIKSLAPGGEIEVLVRETEEIARSSAGKHRFTRSDVTGGAQREAPQVRGSN